MRHQSSVTSYRKVSIIIPAYNEEATIETLIGKVANAQLSDGLIKEIIIINDGSTDKTKDILESIAKQLSIIVVHQENQGKTGALLTGFTKATGDIFLIQDADLEYDPAQYSILLAPILSGQTAVVYGSRFMGQIKDMALINRLANLVSNWTFRLLWNINITDINTCYKIFTRQAWQGIHIFSKRFGFETEVTVKFLRKGLNIKEIPIDYQARSRQAGKKIQWSTALEMYWLIIKYRFAGD